MRVQLISYFSSLFLLLLLLLSIAAISTSKKIRTHIKSEIKQTDPVAHPWIGFSPFSVHFEKTIDSRRSRVQSLGSQEYGVYVSPINKHFRRPQLGTLAKSSATFDTYLSVPASVLHKNTIDQALHSPLTPIVPVSEENISRKRAKKFNISSRVHSMFRNAK